MTTRFKMIRPEIKGVNEDDGTVTAVVSTEAPDRDGDIVRASGWNLGHFQAHPVLLSSHNYGSLKSQIGEWQDVGVRGKRLIGTAKYYVGSGNDEADWGFELAKRGRAAFSVGFIPDMDKAKPIDGKNLGGPLEFRGQELLEISHVTVPANADALQRMKGVDIDPVLRGILDDILDESAPTQRDELIDAIAERVRDRIMVEIWSLGEKLDSILAATIEASPRESRSAKEELIAILEGR